MASGWPRVDRHGFQRLKLKYDEPISDFAFNSTLRHYIMGLYGVDKACIAAMAASGVVTVTLYSLVKLLRGGVKELKEDWLEGKRVDLMTAEMVSAAGTMVFHPPTSELDLSRSCH